MHETFEQVAVYGRMMWQHRWMALSWGSVACLLGWLVVATLPNKYSVEAVIHVETGSILAPLLKGLTAESHVGKHMASLMKQSVLAKPNLEAMAREVGLDKETKTPEEFDKLLDKLPEKILFTETEEKNIYTLSYEDKDPHRAKHAVEVLLDRFFSKVASESRSDSETARRFLDKQIADYKVKLEEAELKLKKYKEKHIGLMPNEGQSYYARLDQLKEQYQIARLELQEAENAASSIRKQITSVEMPDSDASQVNTFRTPLDSRIETLETTLDELLLKYTDQHPDVISTRLAIEQLKKQKKQLLSDSRSDVNKRRNLSNRLFQELKVELGVAEARVASLRARVSEYKQRLNEQEKNVGTVPQIEAELAKLSRDYNIHKDRYEMLVQSRASAQISDEAGLDLKFNLISPPRLPVRPVGPNRLKWITAVLLGGLGAGAGLAFLRSQVNPAIYTRQQLKALTDIPILGTVSLVTPQGQLRHSLQNVSFFGALIALLALYATLVIMYNLNVQFLADLAQLNLKEPIALIKSAVLK